MMHLQFLVCAWLVPLALAGPVKTYKMDLDFELASEACQSGADGYLYDYTADSSPGVYYDTECTYQPCLGSQLLCIASYYEPWSEKFNKSLVYTGFQCKLYGGVDENNFTFYADSYINATKHIQSTDGVNLTEAFFYGPVNVTKAEVDAYYQYLDAIYYNWDMPNTFAAFFYIYFVVVFVIHAVFNLCKRLGWFTSLNNRAIRWWKCHVSTPAIFGSHHTRPLHAFKVFSTLLPTRVESIVVFFFIGLNFIFACVKYNVLLYYPTDTRANVLVILIADRTGLLSFGLVPLLILLAGRNNLLIELTGIPYSSMIVYHKWVSRLMFIHAMIHSACWTAYGVMENELAEYYVDAYWRWGVVATCAAGVMLFQAFHLFRTMSYETFLWIHIVLAIMFMVGCFYHCYSYGYLEWLYASWAMWITERLIRVVRIAWFGSKVADVELIEDDLFRVTLPVGDRYRTFPGAYAYLYFMTPYGFWQAHPFTMLKSVAHPGSLVFTIRAKKGMTRQLTKKLKKSGEKKLKIRVGVEGPYGTRKPVDKYDNVLLISGGSGLPGLLAQALDLTSRESINKQNVKLVWAIKDPHDYDAFADEIAVLATRKIDVDVYVTRNDAVKFESADNIFEKNTGASSDEVSAKSSEGDVVALPSATVKTTFLHGRPPIPEIIKAMANEETRTLAIMTCGPPRLCDDVRALSSKTMGESGNVVDLFEELQVW